MSGTASAVEQMSTDEKISLVRHICEVQLHQFVEANNHNFIWYFMPLWYEGWKIVAHMLCRTNIALQA